MKKQLELPFDQIDQSKLFFGEEDDVITSKDLYPELNEEQLAEAEYNLKRYFEICLEIYKDNEDRLEEMLKEKLTAEDRM